MAFAPSALPYTHDIVHYIIYLVGLLTSVSRPAASAAVTSRRNTPKPSESRARVVMGDAADAMEYAVARSGGHTPERVQVAQAS